MHEAITRLRRDKTPATVAAVARRADVSPTFLYTNSDAKTAVAKAIRETAAKRDRLQDKQDDAGAASWRERAPNAEHALKTANHEIMTQRTRIGELLGRIRDLEAEWTPGRDPARHHREHHTQAACPQAHRRQPHPERTPQRRPLQPALPGPAYRRPRSPACRPQRRPLISPTDTLPAPRHHRMS
ncbi:hypothetical protein [Mycobacterium avium]